MARRAVRVEGNKTVVAILELTPNASTVAAERRLPASEECMQKDKTGDSYLFY